MDSLKQQIKQLSLKDVIEHETGQQFKQVGSNLVLPVCPFCGSGSKENKTPAFTLNERDNLFKCFACDAAGDVFSFIEKLHGLDFRGAYFYLAKNYLGVEPQQYENKKLTDWERKLYAIKSNPRQQAAMYLKDYRHLPVERLPRNAFYYDTQRNAVVFTDTDEKIINLRFIQPQPGQSKSIIEKCCRNETLHNKLYDRAYFADRDRVLLTEGVINALSFYPRYSALAIFTTSNRFTDAQKLARYIKDKDVILAFDPDDAGDKATQYYRDFILKNIPVKSLTRLNLPKGMDVNDLLQEKQLWQWITNPDNYEYIKIDIRRRPLTFNTVYADEFEAENGFFIQHSQYYYSKATRDGKHRVPVSDCVWQYLYRILDSNGNATHLIKIQRYDRKADRLIIRLIEADTAQIQRSEFEKMLNNIGFSFWGPSHVYNRIKTYNLHQEREAVKIERYGFNPEYEIFFWSNLAVDINGNVLKPNELGIIEIDDRAFYLPTASPANKDKQVYAELRKFEHRATDMDIKTFARLFFQAYGLNAIVGLAYLAASLNRDVIFAETSRFPNLYLYGPAGTGKSTYAQILMSLQGDHTGGLTVGSSLAAFNRLINSRTNSLIYFKEFRPETVTNYILDFLKTAYEGQGRSIGVKTVGNEVMTYKVESGIIIDANFLPITDEAVFSRMIFLDFVHSKFTRKQTEAFEVLNKEKNYERGLAQIGLVLLSARSKLKQQFAQKLNFYQKLIKQERPHLPERLIMHTSLILAVWEIIEPLTGLQVLDKLVDFMDENMQQHLERQDTFRHTRLFWEAIAIAIKQDKVRDIENEYSRYGLHYRLLRDRHIFAIKASDFKEYNMLYTRYCKDINITPINDKQLKEQLLSSEYYVKPGNGRRTTQDKIFGTTAFYFRYEPVNDNIIQIDGVTIELKL